MSWTLKWHYLGIIDCLLRDISANGGAFIQSIQGKSDGWLKAAFTGATANGIDGKAALLEEIKTHAGITAASPFPWVPAEFDALNMKVTKSNNPPETEITLSRDTLYLPWELLESLWAKHGSGGSLRGGAYVADRPTFSAQAHVRTRAVLDAADILIECEGVNQAPSGGMKAAIQSRAGQFAQYASYASQLGDYDVSPISLMSIASTYFKPSNTAGKVRLVLGLQKTTGAPAGDPLGPLAPAYPCGAITGAPRC